MIELPLRYSKIKVGVLFNNARWAVNTRYAQTVKDWALPKPASFAKKQAGYINRN